MSLANAYAWYLEDINKLMELACLFSEEVGLDDTQTIELFETIIGEGLTFNEFLHILDENYNGELMTFVLLFEDTPVPELKRKVRIEQGKKKLAQSERPDPGDTAVQKIAKSTNRLASKSITKAGDFTQRKDPGDPNKIRKNLQKKQIEFLSTTGKLRSRAASEKRQRTAKGGSAKFVSKLAA